MKIDRLIKHLIWFCTALCILVVLLCLFTFNIEDKTLYNKGTEEYNEGWTVAGSLEGETIKLPCSKKVSKDTVFSVDKIISEEDCGKTISFLSADSAVKIYVGDELIYEFGNKDSRWFGKTPGSIWVFADIPNGSAGQTLRIEKISPYDNYAGDFKGIVIGSRDECILKFIKDNIFKVSECVLTVLGAIMLALIAGVMVLMKQDSKSLGYFVGFVLASDIYYFIETKLVVIFYGNETLYSILVFLALIMAPMFLTQYYKNRLLSNMRKTLTVVQIATIVNCIGQIVLQLSGTKDFMEMASISHFIIGVTIAVIVFGFISKPKETRKFDDNVELIAILIYMVGVATDLVSTIMGKTGDLGQYSRFVNLIYTFVMVILYGRYLIRFNDNKFRELSEKLKVEKQAAEHANKEKSIFLSNMSHEIRTPIQGILGYNEMIIRETEDKDIDEYAINVQAAARNLLGIVSQILDYTNIEEGVININEEEYGTYSIIQDTTLYTEFGAKKKNLNFITEYDENIPAALLGDSTRILQIFNNLISNAIKYTDEGFVKLKVWWEYTDENKKEGKMNIQVSDSGIGIKKENIEKIQEDFTRFERANTSKATGVGLGLTIVNRLLRLMNGTFDIESEYGNGSVIKVTIPQKVVDATPVGKWNFGVQDEEVKDDTSNYNRQVRVMVVDDNYINCDVVAHNLKKHGISVHTASDGRDALEKLKTDDNYDIIFMDHMMPVMDGIEALTEIKKLGLCTNTKIIAFTANAVDGIKDMYINAGFDDYVTKPISGKRLLEVVKKYISKEKRKMGDSEEKVPVKTEKVKPVDEIENSNILVVDDDKINLRVAQRMLKDKFNVFTANSAREAFDILETDNINLILLDVHMPQMDGHEVIIKLKSTEKYKDIPVIFLTADSDEDTEVQGFSEGAMDFITKPFRKDILIGRIGRILELSYLQKNLQAEVVKQTKKAEMRRKKVETMSLQMVQTLASTIDAKDKYTNGHSMRVAQYSAILAKASGLSKEEVDNIKYAALLHDIGKIGVADSVLNKPGKLTDSEYEVIKSHTTIGSEILQNISTIATAEYVARHHHERYDGKGYPDKLKGEEIPFEARIVCIADAYDAMNSRRVYRKNLTKEKIRQELINGRGTQFDPKYLDIFIDLFDNNELEIHEEKTNDPRIAESGLILQKVMQTMTSQSNENEKDALTGLMLRKEGEEAITIAMTEENGYLAFVDLDNLKKINDTIGHIAGDQAITTLANVLAKDSENTIACRIGGDEFLYYMKNFTWEQVEERINSIMKEFDEVKEGLVSIKQASVSAGICATKPTDDLVDVKSKADKALYYVKQNGKAGYYLYKDDASGKIAVNKNVDIEKLVKGLEKSGGYEGALDMDYRAFAKIFEFLKNIEERYNHDCKISLITLDAINADDIELEQLENAMVCMEKSIQTTIRNVDVYTRYSSVQYLIIFFDVMDNNDIVSIVNRIFQNFYKMYDKNNIELHYNIAELNGKEKEEK